MYSLSDSGEISKRYFEGKMRCPTHLSVGQEAVPSAFSQITRKNDFAVSSHRGHAHYLAKGGNLKSTKMENHGRLRSRCRNFFTILLRAFLEDLR